MLLVLMNVYCIFYYQEHLIVLVGSTYIKSCVNKKILQTLGHMQLSVSLYKCILVIFVTSVYILSKQHCFKDDLIVHII